MAVMDSPSKLLSGIEWKVHKFGGTSVASAECFLRVAKIIEDEIGSNDGKEGGGGADDSFLLSKCNLAIVLSAMGGKPKVTDLLLSAVGFASQRDDANVKQVLDALLDKHKTCLNSLFGGSNDKEVNDRLTSIVERDIHDINDILKTVSLMKWQAQRISELVSGYGELWSSQIFCALLQKRSRERLARQRENLKDSSSLTADSLDVESHIVQHEYIYLDARRVITIDEEAIQHGQVCWDISKTKLQTMYEDAWGAIVKNAQQSEPLNNILVHFVVTGYVASNTEGVATTLQRDGSDYSASIMGRLLSASSVTIWTDVDGVLSADPRRVPSAFVLDNVSYNEAMELAHFGAKVIHPKTIQPALMAEPRFPIFIRNTFNPSFHGTRIFMTAERDTTVCGFSSIDNLALINVQGSGLIGTSGVVHRIFSCLQQAGVHVFLISQAASEHTITFATTEGHAHMARHAVEEEFFREFKANRISNIDILMPCSVIAAVGDGMQKTTGTSGRFFTALGDAKINVLTISQGSSETNISAVVKAEDSTRALRAVHAAFRLSHATVRVGLVGVNELGESLLKLLATQREKIKRSFDIDLQVCAVLENGASNDFVSLKNDEDWGVDSITLSGYKRTVGANANPEDITSLASGGVNAFVKHIFREDCTHHVIFDCTNEIELGSQHAALLEIGIHLVTANNTGLSGPKEQRNAITAAEKKHGKHSARYLREVTVGGGLPVLSTLHNLLDSGDSIRLIDGIFSVSLSFIMFRISPPPSYARCSEFDEHFSHGAFLSNEAKIPTMDEVEGCSLSQAIQEAAALGLMEDDPVMDFSNDYTSRVLMVLAKELGIDGDSSFETIRDSSEKLVEASSFADLTSAETDLIVKQKVDAAKEKGCVLRHISRIDVKQKSIDIKVIEVPETHVFAVTPPSCECVRFFTRRHETYPLIIQGPSAGADSTASALLAEVLHLMRERVGPRPTELPRLFSSESLAISPHSSSLNLGP